MSTTDIPTTQTAARVQNPGPEAQFTIQNGQTVPQPSTNQILVKLSVAGLWWLSRPCMECEVCDVDYTSCPKQKNLGRDLPGTFQQYIAVDAAFVHPLPDNLRGDIAAPLLCAGISMYSAIRKCNLQTDNWLLIPGAGGGLGHLGVQIARAQGYRVIAVDTCQQKSKGSPL
ncbi:alcohol dehydrogenase [Fusarium mexicanum]|uniref:Alcohol dehydrogenase n=1 Tax=Fusarium mexicanum TaxID=751941 RepID=A0A8H5N7K8_9HYPO|nr:alcohol dehydrogenase [Fusarium mexicanum]